MAQAPPRCLCDDWTGWWGPELPYHAGVFVLTDHRHDPIQMGVIDELILDIAPVLLGSGERIVDGMSLSARAGRGADEPGLS